MNHSRKPPTVEDRLYAEQLAQMRYDAHLTLRAVSQAVGIAQSTLWSYENAASKCPSKQRQRLEQFYLRSSDNDNKTLLRQTEQLLQRHDIPKSGLIALFDNLCRMNTAGIYRVSGYIKDLIGNPEYDSSSARHNR